MKMKEAEILNKKNIKINNNKINKKIQEEKNIYIKKKTSKNKYEKYEQKFKEDMNEISEYLLNKEKNINNNLINDKKTINEEIEIDPEMVDIFNTFSKTIKKTKNNINTKKELTNNNKKINLNNNKEYNNNRLINTNNKINTESINNNLVIEKDINITKKEIFINEIIDEKKSELEKYLKILDKEILNINKIKNEYQKINLNYNNAIEKHKRIKNELKNKYAIKKEEEIKKIENEKKIIKNKNILLDFPKEKKKDNILEIKNEIEKIKNEIKEKEEFFRNSIEKIEKEYIEVNQINIKFKKILKYYEDRMN